MKVIKFRGINPYTESYEYWTPQSEIDKQLDHYFWTLCSNFEQYTGLKDKNGKELYYDSDLVELDGFAGLWKATKDKFDIPIFVRTDDSLDSVGFDEQFLGLTKKKDGFEIVYI